MMYQFDVSMGASPDWATVNDTPFESYVGEPDAVNWFDSPEVKSMLIDFESAGSAGQLFCCVGLQLLVV
jgi:hypothetical protein